MRKNKLWVVLSLFITCLISAFALSQVYTTTIPRIEYQRNVAVIKVALGTVIPEADRFEPATLDSTVWFAYSGELRIGTIVRAAEQGYAGLVPVTAGLDTTGKIIGVRVATSAEGLKETPGLGLKATEPGFLKQFIGRTAQELRLKNEGGTIEAITGATITSRAVTDGLRKALEKYQPLLKPENEPGVN